MKYRNGFVSNSSSSSFVIIANSEVFEQKLNQAGPLIRHVMEGWFNKQILAGQSLTFAHGCFSNEYEIEDFDGEIPKGQYGHPMNTDEVIRQFANLFKKDEAFINWEGY